MPLSFRVITCDSHQTQLYIYIFIYIYLYLLSQASSSSSINGQSTRQLSLTFGVGSTGCVAAAKGMSDGGRMRLVELRLQTPTGRAIEVEQAGGRGRGGGDDGGIVDVKAR